MELQTQHFDKEELSNYYLPRALKSISNTHTLRTSFGGYFNYTQRWKELKSYENVFEAFYWYMVEIYFKFDLTITWIKTGIIKMVWYVLPLFLIDDFMYYNLIEEITSITIIACAVTSLDATWHPIRYF